MEEEWGGDEVVFEDNDFTVFLDDFAYSGENRLSETEVLISQDNICLSEGVRFRDDFSCLLDFG